MCAVSFTLIVFSVIGHREAFVSVVARNVCTVVNSMNQVARYNSTVGNYVNTGARYNNTVGKYVNLVTSSMNQVASFNNHVAPNYKKGGNSSEIPAFSELVVKGLLVSGYSCKLQSAYLLVLGA